MSTREIILGSTDIIRPGDFYTYDGQGWHTIPDRNHPLTGLTVLRGMHETQIKQVKRHVDVADHGDRGEPFDTPVTAPSDVSDGLLVVADTDEDTMVVTDAELSEMAPDMPVSVSGKIQINLQRGSELVVPLPSGHVITIERTQDTLMVCAGQRVLYDAHGYAGPAWLATDCKDDTKREWLVRTPKDADDADMRDAS